MFEKFKEFRKDFSERIRSPFVSAMIISWSVYNWKIYYLMFYSAEVITLESRISSIDNYLKSRNNVELIYKPVLAAFVALVVLNVAKSIGLAIKLLYDNWASPYIQKWIYNKNIVERPIYERTLKAFNRVKEELNQKEGAFREANDEVASLNAQLLNHQYNSIKTRHVNLNDLFDIEYTWINRSSKQNDKEYEDENFTIDMNNMVLQFGEKVEIKSIKMSDDGYIVYFEKHFKDGRIYPNYLIRNRDGDFDGIENGSVKIQYIKKSQKPKYMVK